MNSKYEILLDRNGTPAWIESIIEDYIISENIFLIRVNDQ